MSNGEKMELPDEERLMRVVVDVLRNAWGYEPEITLSRLTDIDRRNQVYRVQIENPLADGARSVIVKCSTHKDGFIRDWCGLQFLTEVGSIAHPLFVGGDLDANILVIEDVGNGSGFHDVLLHGTADEAEAALLQFAKTVGNMHASTIGEAERYAVLCEKLGMRVEPRAIPRLSKEVGEMIQAVAEVLPLQTSAAFYGELGSLEMRMHEPGPFFVFTHGDPCPDNWVMTSSGAKLIDYEFARFQHALLDGAYGHILFPTCWCVGVIPDTVVSRMEAVYRSELVRSFPSFADGDLFRREMSAACAYWVWSNVRGMLRGAVEKADMWGTSTTRARIVTRLERFLKITEGTGDFPAIRKVSAQLLSMLRERWPGEQLSLYPAFRKGLDGQIGQ